MALYKRYNEYHEAGRFRRPLTVASFGRYLNGVNGVTRDYTRAGTVYRLDPDAMRACLEHNKVFDEDASLI